ncbi:MAG: GSCFA domain-containing protein [Bacteroidetes bacterium]|nr:MAG: GSCFA domain-containing protein [Bacteroidota bacterium]
MKLLADIRIAPHESPLAYGDKMLLLGSCFTSNIGQLLAQHKFAVLHNPSGILFDPLSVSRHLHDYMTGRTYTEKDLFAHGELFHSWQHHSDFSSMHAADVAAKISEATNRARDFLREARFLVITLGTAFSYRLKNTGQAVANCHKVPATEFHKHLCDAGEITNLLDEVLAALKAFNPALQVIFTISPVRHLRDGMIENNRSKAQLIEAVHRLCEKQDHLYYFPAYELVIDVLRDYRWFDIDLAHPNYAATEFVFEKFCEACISAGSRRFMEDVKQVTIARRHRPQFPETAAHRQFLEKNREKVLALSMSLPGIDWSDEMTYFSGK